MRSELQPAPRLHRAPRAPVPPQRARTRCPKGRRASPVVRLGDAQGRNAGQRRAAVPRELQQQRDPEAGVRRDEQRDLEAAAVNSASSVPAGTPVYRSAAASRGAAGGQAVRRLAAPRLKSMTTSSRAHRRSTAPSGHPVGAAPRRRPHRAQCGAVAGRRRADPGQLGKLRRRHEDRPPMRPLAPMRTAQTGRRSATRSIEESVGSLRPRRRRNAARPRGSPSHAARAARCARGTPRASLISSRCCRPTDARGSPPHAAERWSRRAAAHRFHPLVAQPKDPSGLCLGGDLRASHRPRASVPQHCRPRRRWQSSPEPRSSGARRRARTARARARRSRHTDPADRRCDPLRPHPEAHAITGVDASGRPSRRACVCGARAPGPRQVVAGITHDPARAATARTASAAAGRSPG